MHDHLTLRQRRITVAVDIGIVTLIAWLFAALHCAGVTP